MDSTNDLGAFSNLAEAVGLTEGGEFQGAWFEDPIGRADGSKRGLSSVIYTDDQREALMNFLDEVLGPPDQETLNDAVWVPLFSDSGATIFAVVKAVDGAARIGFGVEYESSSATPSVAVRAHVPVFQLPREGGVAPDTSGSLPDWSLLGREGGCIELSLDITISNAAPVAGELYLGGVFLSACIPTTDDDNFRLSVGFRRLQLPGTSSPRDLDLSIESLKELDSEILEFLTALLQAQAQALDPGNSDTAPFAAIAALLGIRSVTDIPSFPIEELINRGIPAIVDWVESIFVDDDSRDAWLGELASLLGGSVNTVRDSIEFTSGDITGSVGIRIGQAAGGGITVVPWAEVALRPRAGAEVRLLADVLQADTTDGSIVALPNISCGAVFGRDAGAPSDLLNGANQRIGSIHAGLVLQQGSPAFSLTAHDVTLAGLNHPLLDLSSPDAALDAASSVLDGALQALIDELGRPGELINILIGLNPPAAISALNSADLISDPLGTLVDYWHDLTNNIAAFRTVLNALRELVTGSTTAVSGAGTLADPLLIDIAPLDFLFWRDGEEFCVDLRLRAGADVNDTLKAWVGLRASVACINVVNPAITVMSRVVGSTILARIDEQTARLGLGPIDLTADAIGADVIWSARGGLNFELHAPGLGLEYEDNNNATQQVDIPLPTFSPDGAVSFEPDWSQIEQILAQLINRTESEVLNALTDLVGWGSSRAGLSLEALVNNPEEAIRDWLAELVLDCTNVRSVMSPIALLLSGFRSSLIFGSGDERKPFRAAIASEHRAPGMAAWFEPGCPPAVDRYQSTYNPPELDFPPEDGELVNALEEAANSLPDLADLLVGRSSLDQGFQELIARMVGTDGLVGRPVVLPDGVNGIDIPGYGYRELLAHGASHGIAGELFDSVPDAVIYVGCESIWADAFAANSIDARTSTPSSSIAASADGVWSLALPTLEQAAADRPDRGAIGEQAARIVAALQGRTAGLSIIAYGSAGAAAVSAANSISSVDRVVTVGSAWSGFSNNGFTSGLGADALRLIKQIRRPLPPIDANDFDADLTSQELEALLFDESGPLQQMDYLIDRALQAANLTDQPLGQMPNVSEQIIRAGLTVDAAFGLLDIDTLQHGLAHLVSDAITHQGMLYAESRPSVQQPPDALHAGVDLPVIDLNLAGVLVGAGATVKLVSFDRGTEGDSFRVQTEPQLILDLRFGVHDGWLVGGPGALQSDINIRWVSARIKMPIGGSSGAAEASLVLHEASCFGVQRPRWLVDIDADGVAGSLPNSEVHIMLDAVFSKLAATSSELSELFAHVGLIRNGGYDPQGFDRFIFDTQLIISNALNSDAADLANLIRVLGGFTGSGSSITWSVDQATVSLDLQTRTLHAGFSHQLAHATPITVNTELSPQGLRINAALGEITASSGGLRLAARFDSIDTDLDKSLAVEWQLPGASTVSTIALLPLTRPDELIKILASFVPATVAVNALGYLRESLSLSAQDALDVILDSLSLLAPPVADQPRRITMPWLLFISPKAWIDNAAQGWVADPFAEAINILDALAPLVSSNVPDGDGWQLSDDISIRYSAEGGRLNLMADLSVEHSLDAVLMRLVLVGGISIAQTGDVSPLMSSALTFDGKGVEFKIQPTVQLNLVRAAPAAPMAIYPASAGLGSLLETGAGMAIPVAFNALIDLRNNPSDSLERSVARVLFDLGGALDLLQANRFTESKINTFAADPIRGLTANLGQLAGVGLSNLASALDPAQSVVVASNDGPGRTKLAFGATQSVAIILDGSTNGPAVELFGEIEIDDVGTLTIDQVRLAIDGVQVSADFVATNLEVGNGLRLMPIASVRAGVSSTGFQRLVGVGLATDGVGDQSIEFRWNLDGSLPRMVVVNRTISGESEVDDLESVAMSLLSLLIPMAVNVTLEALDPVGDKVIDVLQNVAFTGGTSNLDTSLIEDFKDPVKLLNRLYQLAFNLASEGIKITIDNKVDIGFTGVGNRAGVFVSLAPGERIALGSGDPSVALEIVADWISVSEVGPGLSVFLVERNGDNFDLSPSFAIAGLGLRVSKTSGPLLNLGLMAIDAIGVHTYGEVAPAGIGAGVRVQLDGLAFTPSAGSGDNAVANNIMSDAADDASPSTRPAFSPSLAIQKGPGGDVGVTLRAGDPPGPWWVGIQRQLGPLYLEQFGFDVTEQEGSITGMSLLFDARISLFGLSAEVDQLGLHWLGGDAFDLNNWAVDLQGLAVSGDFGGLSISGGLLKTEMDGSIGYVGMLMGRFGVYGLSLFGGYSSQEGFPSFFVFGAIQGPIGGPPAFFLTGIGGGLGIKRGLRVPDDLSKFGEYPFIKALDPSASVSQSPLQELRELAEYFPVEPGNMWFAAGISFTSFALVDGIAVVAVSFGNGFDLNLFGLARLALPRPQAALVSIELGLLARFSTREGLFLIQAQLTDNSWLLYPEVRLTGGFAFATWWKGENAGQFVLTLGGYHPSFSKPGYPVVPRLGLEWRVTDNIVIKGGSYFALTSEALMAGVAIEVSADFGFVWARIAFGADGIVYFDPFYFMVDAYARIAAGIKIKTFLGTIRISISIGATVHVEGPSFHGRATIEVGPADITVPFGDQTPRRGVPLDWLAFVPKYLEEVAPGRATVVSGVTGKGSLPAATGGDTSAPSSDGSRERPFEVYAEFEMTMVTTVPTTKFDFGSSSTNQTIMPKLSDGRSYDIGLGPMDAIELESELRVRLHKKVNNNWGNRSTELQRLVDGIERDDTLAEGPSFGLDAFPLGVWGAPKDPNQPSDPLPKGDVVFAGNRLKLVASADIEGKTGPEIDYYKVESGRRPLPLTAKGNSRLSLLNTAGGLSINEFASDATSALVIAEEQLFAARPGQRVDGIIDLGRQRSASAKASYARSRTAPPLFGTLTEGMLSENDGRAPSEDMPTRRTPAIPQQRPPFITGYMVSGAGVTAAKLGTSVRDGRIKRRPAPTLDSVRGRLGRSLPIKINSIAAPAVVKENTLLARGSIPFTNLGGVARSYRGGHIGTAVGGSLVGGLAGSAVALNSARSGAQARGLEPGSRIRPGDVVAMRLPDAATDFADDRPILTVEGRARVVMLKGNGIVVADDILTDTGITMPKCTANIVIQADGGRYSATNFSPQEQVIGWHDQSQLARLGGRSSLGASCLVNVEGATGPSKVGWSIACDFVRDAAAVSTRFSTLVRTVGIVLRANRDSGQAASQLRQSIRDMEIELTGAKRAGSGSLDKEPAVIQAGPRAIMLFEVIPDQSDSEIIVRVTSGGTKQVAGVIGTENTVDNVSDLIAERGLLAVVNRMREVRGEGCTVTWNAPSDSSPGGASRDGASRDAAPTSRARKPIRPATKRTKKVTNAKTKKVANKSRKNVKTNNSQDRAG